jgi:hypothetical protein
MRTFLSFAFAAALAASSIPAFAQTAPGAAAQPSCPASDPVVWLNTDSNVFHLKGDRYFGTTKSGKYLCESQAVTAGGREAKKSVPPGAKSGIKTTDSSVPVTAPAGKATLAPSVAATATPAGTKHHRKSKLATPAPGAAAAVPGAAATATPVGSKHHRKSKLASPAPGASPDASTSPAPKKKHHKSKATPAPDAAATALPSASAK